MALVPRAHLYVAESPPEPARKPDDSGIFLGDTPPQAAKPKPAAPTMLSTLASFRTPLGATRPPCKTYIKETPMKNLGTHKQHVEVPKISRSFSNEPPHFAQSVALLPTPSAAALGHDSQRDLWSAEAARFKVTPGSAGSAGSSAASAASTAYNGFSSTAPGSAAGTSTHEPSFWSVPRQSGCIQIHTGISI